MTSKLQSGARFLAYPEPLQIAILMHWIGCQRHIYNQKVEEDRMFTAMRRLMLRADPFASVSTPVDRLYSQFKDDELTPWLSDVPSQVLREGTYRWFNAKQRQLKGLAGAPRRRHRRNFNSVLLTSDLFHFEDGRLFIGTEKFFVGELRFNAHRAYGAPKMITISESAGRWYVSFSYEHEVPEVLRESHELAYELDLLDDDAVAEATIGIDRNVADNCMASSRGNFYVPERIQLDRIERKEIGLRRYQRRFARSRKGSANRRKLALRMARKQEYKANVLRDFAHKASHDLATSGAKLIVFEDLQIKNMVRRPKPKQDELGRWVKNGAAAKEGLNRAILSSAWGWIASFTEYKAARRNAIVAYVKPHFTSQECSRCGHTHPDNRHGALFVCQRCGYSTHADLNASDNIKKRGICRLRSGELSRPQPSRKRIAKKRFNELSGSERPDVSAERQEDATPSLRAAVARDAVKQKAQAVRSDAPTTAPIGV
jgi:putative transposase